MLSERRAARRRRRYRLRLGIFCIVHNPSLSSHGASRETWDDSVHRMTHFDTPDPIRTEPPAGNTAATEWDRTAAQRALDELFQFALQYDSCQEFQDLMRFIARFLLYSPFNADARTHSEAWS